VAEGVGTGRELGVVDVGRRFVDGSHHIQKFDLELIGGFRP